MRKLLGIAVAAILASFTTAQAETNFPNKPVTIVVSLAAGGPSDTVCRILADELTKIWKQQVIVENRPGGGTFLGNNYVARSKPDGYTWLHASASFLISPAVRSNVPYDTLKDFTPISIIVDAPLAIVAHPGFAPNTLPELIALAKTRTDQPLNFASSGIASSSHMTGERLQRRAGFKLKHIVYSGEAAGMTDTLTGRVDFQIGTWSTQKPYVDSGKLKLISVIYPKRLAEAPNVPTVYELFPDLNDGSLDVFNSIIVPSGVPDDVRAKIAEGIKQAVSSDSYKDRIRATGSNPHYTTPAESEAFFRKVAAEWVQVAKEANIHLD